MKISRTQRLVAGAVFLAVLVAIAIYRPGGPGGPAVDPSASSAPSGSAASASPSGAVGSGSPGASASASSPAATTTPFPSITAPPTPRGADVLGSWTGTWNQAQPFPASGQLTIAITQDGSTLTARVVMTDNTCFTEGQFQVEVSGQDVGLHNTLRDEVELDGSAAGNSMSGDLSMACDNAMGTFSVVRSY